MTQARSFLLGERANTERRSSLDPKTRARSARSEQRDSLSSRSSNYRSSIQNVAAGARMRDERIATTQTSHREQFPEANGYPGCRTMLRIEFFGTARTPGLPSRTSPFTCSDVVSGEERLFSSRGAATRALSLAESVTRRLPPSSSSSSKRPSFYFATVRRAACMRRQ